MKVVAGVNVSMENLAIPEFEPRSTADRLEQINQRLDVVNTEIEKIRATKLSPPELDSYISEAERLNAELVKLTVERK